MFFRGDYLIFIEAALKQLKNDGFLSYITPDTFLRKDDHVAAREYLLKNYSALDLVETGPVFSKVRDTWCLVSLFVKSSPASLNLITHKKLSRFIISAENRLEKFGRKEWDKETITSQSTWLKKKDFIIAYLASENDQKLIDKIELQPRLNELSEMYLISRGEEGSKFSLKNDEKGNFNMVIPADIRRYGINNGVRISDNTLTDTKTARLYKHPKIWIIRIQKMRWKQRLVCTFDERTNSAGMKTLQIIVSPNDNKDDLKYLTGILSSKLINYWCINYLSDDLNQSFLEKNPVILNNAELYKGMVSNVKKMLMLNEQLTEAKTDHEKTLIQRQIDATDNQIDKLVYELYDLTPEEIAIVEGNI